jgi:hypothetical protein
VALLLAHPDASLFCTRAPDALAVAALAAAAAA